MVTSFGATYTSLVPAHAACPVIGAFFRRSADYCVYPRMADRVVVIAITRKLRGQIPASMLERVIQEGLCRAILGLNVRHDLDIEPATRSVSSLPGNVCLTCSDGLLIGYKVACQFESHPLRHAYMDPARVKG